MEKGNEKRERTKREKEKLTVERGKCKGQVEGRGRKRGRGKKKRKGKKEEEGRKEKKGREKEKGEVERGIRNGKGEEVKM